MNGKQASPTVIIPEPTKMSPSSSLSRTSQGTRVVTNDNNSAPTPAATTQQKRDISTAATIARISDSFPWLEERDVTSTTAPIPDEDSFPLIHKRGTVPEDDSFPFIQRRDTVPDDDSFPFIQKRGGIPSDDSFPFIESEETNKEQN